MLRNERGSLLVHVLVTSVVISVIAAGLMRMILARYYASEQMSTRMATRKSADAGLERMLSQWNATGTSFCSSFPGYTCAGPSTCGATLCTCTPSSTADPKIVATLVGGACKVYICTDSTASCP